ncbi:MAG: hypothetical protein WB535_08180 [Paenarthrobacter sp.]
MSSRNSINSIKGSALQGRRSAVEPAGIGSKSAAAVVSATRPAVVSATRPAAVVTGHIPVEDQQVETRLITKIIATGAAEPQTARSE